MMRLLMRGSRAIFTRSSESSSKTSREKTLTFSPGRSNVTTPSPSSSISRENAFIAASTSRRRPEPPDAPASRQLHDDGSALASSDAHRGEAELGPSPPHFLQEGRDEPVGRGSHGMTERDRAAVDVGFLPVDLPDRPAGPVPGVPGRRREDLRAGQDLRGERLVDLHQPDVLPFEAGLLQRE